METCATNKPDTATPLDPASLRALVLAGLLTLIGDFLLWPTTPRLSLGIFGLAIGIAILLNRPIISVSRRAGITCLLLAATAVQTGIELSFSNLLVLLLLLGALLGERVWPEIKEQWRRWMNGIGTLLRAPWVWWWPLPMLRRVSWRPSDSRQIRAVLLQVVAPTLVIFAIFAILLSLGNPVLASWIGEIFSRGWELTPKLSVPRILLWMLLLIFSLGVLTPFAKRAGGVGSFHIPTLAEPPDLRLARWRSLAVLATLNILFFTANTIDAVYLWVHQALPGGIAYSEYVHRGVYSLTLAVLLSAGVLTLIFQQSPSVVQSRIMRTLSLIWLAQNVVLIASVLLRLQLYVQAYQLTEQRVYVAFFLVLVAAGFALLAWRIVARKSLGWLLLANTLDTFALFFLVQFLDVAGWVADYNVTRWQNDPKRALDVDYLAGLGPAAYGPLTRAVETPARPEAHDAFLYLQERKAVEQARLATQNWRSRQIRPDASARRLVEHEFRTGR